MCGFTKMEYNEWMNTFNDTWIKQHLVHTYPPKQHIPKLLHLIWVGKVAPPETLSVYLAKWKELMPLWTIRLWTNDDIHEFSPEIIAKLAETNTGVQKADIMRYSIIEKYGGFYMDADMTPIKELDSLIYMSDLVVCHDNYITWEYISVGFFGAKPNHPVMKKAVEISLSAQVNTGEPHMSTGPRLLGLAVSTVPPVCDKYTLLSIGTFYRADTSGECEIPEKFAEHQYARNWDN